MSWAKPIKLSDADESKDLYIDPDTIEWLVQYKDYTEIHTVSGNVAVVNERADRILQLLALVEVYYDDGEDYLQ